MPNVVAVVKDDRVRRQIEQYLKELKMEDLRFMTFKRLEDFESLYYREITGVPVEAQDAGARAPSADATVGPFPDINLMVYALDSVGGKSGAWIDKVRTNLKRYRREPGNNQARFVLLKYEDDSVSKLDLLHPALDDLIYLPLDRLIFMQKMEIILGLPKLVPPSILFSQTVRHNIEISKIVKLDRLSDVGMAIRNPVPLKKGLPGKFYLLLPGEKNRLELSGKVMRSEPHPEYPGQYLVYFGFFGLPKVALTQIRRTLSKAPRYQSLRSEDREAVTYRPDELFGTVEQQQNYTLAVIDPDEATSNALALQLSKEMDRLQVVTESSYSLFLHKYFGAGGVGKETPPQPTLEADFYSPLVSMSLNLTDMKCLGVEPAPNETDMFLGHSASVLFNSPDKWVTLLQDKEAKLILDEALQLAARGRAMEKLVAILDSDNNRRAVNFKIFKSDTENQLTVLMSPAGLGDIMQKLTSEDTSKALDVMIVETSFVPEDSAAWIDGLRNRAMQLNFIKHPEQLKFMLVSDGENLRHSEKWLRSPDILGLFIKPVDTRQMLYFLSEYLSNQNTLFHFNNLGWSAPGVPVHVSKQVHLEALSEYGATLRSTAKLAPGSMVYLRKSIYDNAPNTCLAARVYYCENHPSEANCYHVFATYFGINESFLKFARTWIRENYAQQKNTKGG